MSYKRSDWPLKLDQLEHLIHLGESTLVEFKREWPPLDGREGQAKIARQVMAMANAVGAEDLGLIIYGVEDERRGGKIVGVSTTPNETEVAQWMTTYVHPPVNVQSRLYTFGKKVVSVLAVLHSPARPHYCIREFSGILTTRDVYVRRDKQVGVLTPPELVRMSRDGEGDTSAGDHQFDPVEFGIVAIPDPTGHTITIRIQNLGVEPLTEVWLSFDARNAKDSSIMHRTHSLSGATLAPGEARESSLDLAQITYYKTSWSASPHQSFEVSAVKRSAVVGERWIDITATLWFRAASGLMASKELSYSWDGG